MWKLRVGNISEIILFELDIIIKPSLAYVVKDKIEEFLDLYVKRNIFESFEGEIEFGVFLKILKFRKGLLRDLGFVLDEGYIREREIDLEKVKKDMVYSLFGFPMKHKAYYKLIDFESSFDFTEDIQLILDENLRKLELIFLNEGFSIEDREDVIQIRGFEDIFIEVTEDGAEVLSLGGGFHYHQNVNKVLKMSDGLKKHFEMKKFLSEEHLKENLKKKFFF